jgi:ubiquinone/menaquinone biosynthesis C-methylase UbiE
MRRDWDERARQNARHYVATLQDQWADEEFFQSGSIWIDQYIAPDLDLICGGQPPSAMKILEIGCGAGRMTRPLSRLFGSVEAVDVSREMILCAQSALQDCPNVRFHLNNGTDLSMFSDAEFDFAFSSIVFQHIPRKSIVANYIKEAARVLRPGRIFKFQLQGVSIPEEDVNTWVGAGFSEKEIAALASDHGFAICNATGAGSPDYWLTFKKT